MGYYSDFTIEAVEPNDRFELVQEALSLASGYTFRHGELTEVKFYHAEEIFKDVSKELNCKFTIKRTGENDGDVCMYFAAYGVVEQVQAEVKLVFDVPEWYTQAEVEQAPVPTVIDGAWRFIVTDESTLVLRFISDDQLGMYNKERFLVHETGADHFQDKEHAEKLYLGSAAMAKQFAEICSTLNT